MQSKRVVFMLAAAVLMVFGLLGGGCAAKPGRYTLDVRPDSTLKDRSGRLPDTNVLVVGVSNDNAEKWRNAPVSSIISGDSALVRSAKDQTVSLTFTNSDQGTKTIKSKDKIWDTWKANQATMLFVFVNSSGVQKDLRRQEISLMNDKWKSDTLDIDITSGGVNVHPPIEADK